METSSRLIPLDLAHILIKAGKTNYADKTMQQYKGASWTAVLWLTVSAVFTDRNWP
jgi:predicted negative regulator of RcsB-dependent stress response